MIGISAELLNRTVICDNFLVILVVMKICGIWSQIDVDFCLKLFDTMPQRIADVLKVSGGYTKW
ncbi:990_t:CDS:2 [Entrophospora sp. SA101]|nr:990_t:CDS:2 [Entrophospora sp. SA101]